MGRTPRHEEKSDFFASVFGNTVQVRVAGFFLTDGHCDHSITEVSRACNVDRVSVYRVLPALVKQGIIRKKREVGQAVMYELNKRNPCVQSLTQPHAMSRSSSSS